MLQQVVGKVGPELPLDLLQEVTLWQEETQKERTKTVHIIVHYVIEKYNTLGGSFDLVKHQNP